MSLLSLPKLIPNALRYILNGIDNAVEMTVSSTHFIQHESLGCTAGLSETVIPKPHFPSFLKVSQCILHFTSTPQCQALFS